MISYENITLYCLYRNDWPLVMVSWQEISLTYNSSNNSVNAPLASVKLLYRSVDANRQRLRLSNVLLILWLVPGNLAGSGEKNHLQHRVWLYVIIRVWNSKKLYESSTMKVPKGNGFDSLCMLMCFINIV